jgi:hypothetical protein
MKYKNWLVIFPLCSMLLSSCSSRSSGNSSITTVGNVLHTPTLDITVKRAYVDTAISSGNSLYDYQSKPDTKFIIIKTALKNTGTTNTSLDDGQLVVLYNGKEYKFEKSEPINTEGWVASYYNIVPLSSREVSIAFEVPREINGDFKWIPGNGTDDMAISLGKL